MIKELINFILDRQAKPAIDLVWYDGSKPSKQRIAELRYKLAVARGMLYLLKGGVENVDWTLEELSNAINESAD